MGSAISGGSRRSSWILGDHVLVVTRFFAEGRGSGVPVEAMEFMDAGDSVVVRVDQWGTGPQSGAPGHLQYFQIWTFRGASVIRIESISERADALEAAGLRE
jgi:hypothetical protein